MYTAYLDLPFLHREATIFEDDAALPDAYVAASIRLTLPNKPTLLLMS